MSKAFTKDEGASTDTLVVPPRAPLPEGSRSYVTATGLALLWSELEEPSSSDAGPR